MRLGVNFCSALGKAEIRHAIDSSALACRKNGLEFARCAGLRRHHRDRSLSSRRRRTGCSRWNEPVGLRVESQRGVSAARLLQAALGFFPLDFAAFGAAASVFTRPDSAATWGAAAIGSHPGKPCRMRSAFFTGLMWP